MNQTLVIIAHPDVQNSGVQQFLMESSQNLGGVTNYILTEEAIDIKKEQARFKEYKRIIFQFPMYWYSSPFILKKWLDEVFQDTKTTALLRGKELGLVVSMGVSETSFEAGKSEGFTLSEIFRPFEAFAKKNQMTYLPIFSVSLFSYLTEYKKKELLINYQQYLTKVNNDSFKEKEAWFVKQLEKMTETSNEDLSGILNVLEDNRDELDDLMTLVHEMREE
ncbi:NAD(P)H-dependent oxidoreductase [Vagococcus hydrophili]|uniref:NAD(P)H-dependent oxidoreductase n=1 Tax=Vagococcus hydrophili TaxID=2714947 RepID=A0A6G8AVJ2_9ENTE|nr:NAD(P)H-dependent oxidoreductase [Vagococcus hydrophili]QIL48989.1 NAD(P)H-dependent oxidoreductase [Vagococcus hydrophili]